MKPFFSNFGCPAIKQLMSDGQKAEMLAASNTEDKRSISPPELLNPVREMKQSPSKSSFNRDNHEF